MSEPSREHVEAVAEHLAPKPLSYYRQGYHGTEPDAVRSYFKRAERILTSTDPAVLDAMQDALVRAGRLTEEWGFGVPALDDQPGQYPAKSRQEAEGPHGRKFTHGNPVAVSRRLVTEWQEES